MKSIGNVGFAILVATTITLHVSNEKYVHAETIAEAQFIELVSTGADDKIIYAETPSAQVIPVGVPPVPQMIVRSPLAVLDKQVLQTHGSTVAAEGRSFHYVQPMQTGATFEGVFVRQGGGGMTIGSTTVTKSEKLTFVFDRSGRYSLAKDTDVAIAAANAGGGTSSSGSEAGSYQLSGYALDLYPDDGTPTRLPFFVYTIDPFWPDSTSSGDRVNALNLGTELYYLDSGEK